MEIEMAVMEKLGSLYKGWLDQQIGSCRAKVDLRLQVQLGRRNNPTKGTPCCTGIQPDCRRWFRQNVRSCCSPWINADVYSHYCSSWSPALADRLRRSIPEQREQIWRLYRTGARLHHPRGGGSRLQSQQNRLRYDGWRAWLGRRALGNVWFSWVLPIQGRFMCLTPRHQRWIHSQCHLYRRCHWRINQQGRGAQGNRRTGERIWHQALGRRWKRRPSHPWYEVNPWRENGYDIALTATVLRTVTQEMGNEWLQSQIHAVTTWYRTFHWRTVQKHPSKYISWLTSRIAKSSEAWCGDRLGHDRTYRMQSTFFPVSKSTQDRRTGMH